MHGKLPPDRTLPDGSQDAQATAVDTLRQDLVYALRVLVKRPGLTLVAVLTLTLGIAANSTIFTLINGVLLRPLPYPQADRLVNVWTTYPSGKGQQDIFSPANYADAAARAQTIESAAAYTTFSFTLAGGEVPEFVPGIQATASLADVLQVEPRMGRWFSYTEDDAGADLAVISDSLWRSMFGGDPSILSRSVIVNGRSVSIIGVMPPESGFPTIQTQVYMPIHFTARDKAESNRGNVYGNMIARAKPGQQPAIVSAELHSIAGQLARQSPVDAGIDMGAVSLQSSLTGNMRPTLFALWAAVGFMLAVGCANVANLLLAQAAARRREFALRRSLGATSAILVRQLLTESLVLSGLGGVLGLTLEAWITPLVAKHLPASFAQIRGFGIDSQVVWFTFAVSIFTGVFFGLAPAFGSLRAELSGSLNGGARAGRSSRQQNLGRVLVAGEVAAVLVLLIGAGLVLRSLAQLNRLDPGFRTKGVVVWQMFLPPARYPDANAQRAFYKRVVEEAQSIAGVDAAGIAQPLPFGPVALVNDVNFRIAGRPDAGPDQMPVSLIARADPGYFHAMGIPLLRGRGFDDRDNEKSTAVVISDTFRRVYFPDVDPLTQRLLLGSSRTEVQVVGVVGDVKHNNLRADTRPEFYLPMARFTRPAAGLIVRGSAGSETTLKALRQRLWAIDPGLAANLAEPVEAALDTSLESDRLAMILLVAFAAATLLLGIIGVYGVLSYWVRQRTHEIGIRVALGASRQAVLSLVFREALSMTGAGVAAGLLSAFAVSRFLESLLFEVTPRDPLTFAIACAAVPLAAMAAALTPALRAARVDPAILLRSE
jgi:putative ABC transport system permease protein